MVTDGLINFNFINPYTFSRDGCIADVAFNFVSPFNPSVSSLCLVILRGWYNNSYTVNQIYYPQINSTSLQLNSNGVQHFSIPVCDLPIYYNDYVGLITWNNDSTSTNSLRTFDHGISQQSLRTFQSTMNLTEYNSYLFGFDTRYAIALQFTTIAQCRSKNTIFS